MGENLLSAEAEGGHGGASLRGNTDSQQPVVESMSDWNQKIIDEFRANEGAVGGPFEGKRTLLLHHEGAKTGTWRVNPLAWHPADDGWAIFASKGGAPTNPDWYHNLKANPDARIEVGTETIDVTAREVHDDERQQIWDAVVAERPMFADYQEKTDRTIPVFVLEKR